jgi:acyl dehydratase
MKTFDVRFTAPVYPGEHVETTIWVDGDTVRFRSRVQERDLVVLDLGQCRLQPSSL